MPFQTSGGVRYFTFDSLGDTALTHAVFTRHGGVSPAPWHSLNVGGTVGDEPARVGANRLRAFAALGCDPATLFDVWQVHGTSVAVADAPRPAQSSYEQADAMVTDRPDVTLFMRFADCVPILLYDPVHRAVGLAHAGWMGTVKGTARTMVETMAARYGTRPSDLLAAIGASIGPDHYEVGPEVVLQVRQAFGQNVTEVLKTPDGRVHFDLWAANRINLENAGVRHVEIAGLCTACHPADWYSHRAEQGRTGRFGVLIALKGGFSRSIPAGDLPAGNTAL